MLKSYFCLLLVAVSCFSCVLPSKYQDMVDQRNKLGRENESLLYLKDQSQKDKKYIEEQKQKIKTMEELLFELNTKLSASKDLYSKCQSDYDKMLTENKKMLEKAFSDRSNLNAELADKEKLLAEKEKTLKKLESDLNNKKLAQELLQNDLKLREKKIDSLSSLVELKDKKIADIRKKISDLLIGYSNDEILIEKRSDGKLYITMSQDLLFQKGSDKLDTKGRTIITKIAGAIKSETGFSILVEGHTDTDGSPSRNWDLSVQRAVAVVRVLEENGVMSQKITAAGRSQFMPLLPNTSEANKSKNRRTEIILEPNINEIIQFLN
ncbi:MAG: OmpA family protein [Deltaproteobacteria bacterium]